MGDRLPWTALGEVESRLGIPPIEELLAERAELVRKIAPLRARYGTFGTYDDLRKIELARIAQLLRAVRYAQQTKTTEAEIDEAAHADDRYAAFVTEATEDRAIWSVLEDRIQGITETIHRGQVIARYLTSEVTLER